MAIRAKVTVYDDETGEVYDENTVIMPYSEETDYIGSGSYVEEDYEFRFRFKRLR